MLLLVAQCRAGIQVPILLDAQHGRHLADWQSAAGCQPAPHPFSETQLHSKPELASAGCRRNDAERRTAHCRARIGELRRIGQADGLRAKLRFEPFADREAAEETGIHVEDAGTADNIAAAIAECRCGDGGKGGGIEIWISGPIAAEDLRRWEAPDWRSANCQANSRTSPKS